MAIYETLYPQGNFLDIRANAPTSTDYNIQVMEDLVRNLPGGGIRDLLAPAAAATLSLPYDAIQAATRTTEDDISRAMETAGMYGPKDIASEAYGLAFGRERPLSSAIERTIGASGPLAERINNLNLFNSAVAAEKPTVPNLSLDYNMPTFDLATGITNTSAGLPFRSMADMQEAANKDLVQQIIEQNVNKLAPVTSSVMYDEFPQGFSFRPQAPRSLGFDTSYGVASEPDIEQVESLTETEPSGIAKLLQYLPFGEKSIMGMLLRQLPKESPEIRSMKNFYRNQYGLTPTGQVASGIMAGYNPVYGGLLNMITGGRFGAPTQYGLADAARRRIERIATRKAPQTDASRAKIAELQRFAEADTISRARQAAPEVYREAERQGFTGPGGGFSTSGSKRDSGFTSRSSSPSGRGRQDY